MTTPLHPPICFTADQTPVPLHLGSVVWYAEPGRHMPSQAKIVAWCPIKRSVSIVKCHADGTPLHYARTWAPTDRVWPDQGLLFANPYEAAHRSYATYGAGNQNRG
jgi:hypothetical protein